jgi:hypothetical protein
MARSSDPESATLGGVACIAGKGLASAEMRELMHLLHAIKHAGHAVGEAADKVLDGPDDSNNGRHR